MNENRFGGATSGFAYKMLMPSKTTKSMAVFIRLDAFGALFGESLEGQIGTKKFTQCHEWHSKIDSRSP